MSGFKVNLHLNSSQKMLCDRGLSKMGSVQKIIDSEVLRRSTPYIPMQSGNLIKSGITGTVIGSGEVQYIAPYARRQYYHNAGRGRQGLAKRNAHNYKCLRGKQWFERMKADHKDDILRLAKEKAGGK